MKIKILLIAWARPNFMKIAPIIREIQKYPHEIEFRLIHTGQHFDQNMSDTFFEDLGIPLPDTNLSIHWWSVSDMTGRTMIEFDRLIKEEKPNYVLVVGDVNATIACAFVAKQNGVKVIHVEAWLRSCDRTMPEEVNRVLTDHISDLLFVTEASGITNLEKEGITNWVHLVGNVMIDTLIFQKPIFRDRNTVERMGLSGKDFAILTIHRPSNVDKREDLENLMKNLGKLSEKITLVFPLHPRTRANIEKYNLGALFDTPNIITAEPLGYLDFMHLVTHARCILTDSGGIQEESTYLQVPCLTMRENTERPITCEIGSNTLVGADFEKIETCLDSILAGIYKKWSIPPFWDGKAAERIVKILLNTAL